MLAPENAPIPVSHGRHPAVTPEYGIEALEAGAFLAGYRIGVALEPPSRRLVEIDRDRAAVVVRFVPVLEQAGERRRADAALLHARPGMLAQALERYRCHPRPPRRQCADDGMEYAGGGG